MSRVAFRAHALAALLLLLGACASVPRTPPPAPPPITPASVAAPSAQVEPAPTGVAVDPSPWARLRTRFALPGCDYGDAVLHEARRYARSPKHFTASWKPALPFLLLVLAEIEKRDLPGEFALLPYVESRYRPLSTQGNRPAGMWQLMPGTARERGLRVARDYDGRLDAIEATRAALELIERYDREFGDWRLATMAFNTGEYRVKRVLGERTGDMLDAEALAGLGLSPITHTHLARMLALACIVADPAHFGVDLPEPDADDHLVAEPVEGPFDLRVAAAFAELPAETLLRYNAAHRQLRSATGAPPRILLPATRAARFAAARAEHPGLLAMHWQARAPTRTAGLDELAADTGLEPQALARANGLAEDAHIPAGSELLLPGPPASPPRADALGDVDALHVVRQGDTLSAIARRYGVRLADLLGWNTLRANATLRLGMRLRVRAP